MVESCSLVKVDQRRSKEIPTNLRFVGLQRSKEQLNLTRGAYNGVPESSLNCCGHSPAVHSLNSIVWGTDLRKMT